MTPLRQILRVLAILAVAALVAAGCGDGDGDGAQGTDKNDKQADTSTDAATGGDEGGSGGGGDEALPEVLGAAGERTADITSGRYTLTIELSGDVPADVAQEVSPLTAEIEFSGDDMSFVMDLSAIAGFDDEVTELFGDDLSMEMVASGDALYMKGFFAALFGGDADGWISFPADSADVTPADTDAMTADTWFAMLEGVGDGVEVVGDEELDGVTTTHYTASVTLEELVAADPSSASQFDLEGLEGGDIMMDVWVDGDGFVRRAAFRVDYLGPETDGMSMTVTIDMRDLNEDIEIDVPSEDEVTVLTEEDLLAALFGGLAGGAAGGDTGGLGEIGSQLEDAFGGLGGDDSAQSYGDDPELDALHDRCADGDGQACDDLFYQSPLGSEYEEFGNTCGGRGFEASCADAG